MPKAGKVLRLKAATRTHMRRRSRRRRNRRT